MQYLEILLTRNVKIDSEILHMNVSPSFITVINQKSICARQEKVDGLAVYF